MFAFEPRLARSRFYLSANLRDRFDDQSPAVVDDVVADHAAVDDFGALVNVDGSLDGSEDVAAAAVFDGEIAIDCAADVELSAVGDGDVAAHRAPQLDGVVEDGSAREAAAFFAHGRVL